VLHSEKKGYAQSNLKLAVESLDKMCEVTKVRKIMDETVELALSLRT